MTFLFVQPLKHTTFNKDLLHKAVNIQKKSYQLLLWIKDAIDQGTIGFSKLHENESPSESFLDWLNTYAPYLPPKLLPPEEDFPAFANYFASYLTTSFDLVESPEYKTMSMSGGVCNCPICLRLVQGSHLKVKKPRKADKIEARRKHVESLNTLAQEEDIDISKLDLDKLLAEPFFLVNSAYLAYTKSLLHRMKGEPTGAYVLVLWRQIAWEPTGSPIHGFTLEVVDILNAMHIMKGAMRDSAEK